MTEIHKVSLIGAYENTTSRRDISNAAETVPTAELVGVGLRSHTTDLERALALRCEALRAAMVTLINLQLSEGYGADEEILQLVDVNAEVAASKRFYIEKK
jgi:hypothetical protein